MNVYQVKETSLKKKKNQLPMFYEVMSWFYAVMSWFYVVMSWLLAQKMMTCD